MNKNLLLALVLLLSAAITGNGQSIAEKLGYPPDTKLLIIHADDLGVSHSENEASISAFEKGSVNSGSIMVPCPWFPEIAEYAVNNPASDLGLHLTLTAEWNHFKWGPVAKRDEVPGLVTEKKFLPASVMDVVKKAKPEEVEKELRAQIERAKQFGVDFTHFDSHMGTLFASVEFLKVYIELGHEYRVPVLLHRGLLNSTLKIDLDDYLNENDVLVDQIYIAGPPDFKNGMKNFYSSVLKSLQPGLSCILLHAAYDNSEMQAVTIDQPDYGAAWRQADYDFFTSDECKKILKEQKIQLVTWRELRDKIVRQ